MVWKTHTLGVRVSCVQKKRLFSLYRHPCSGLSLPTWPCRSLVLPPLPHFAEPTWVPRGTVLPHMPFPGFLACPQCQCGVRARCRVRVGHGHSGRDVHHGVAWGEHLFQSLTLKGVRNRGPLSFCPLTLRRKRLTWPRGPSLLWCPRRGHGTRALSGTQLCHSGGW